jgi:Ca-activated chloride channel family protein
MIASVHRLIFAPIAFAVLVWTCVSRVAPQQEIPQVTFRADVGLVEVYAAVFDSKGHYVTGLTQEQFEVRDNGKPESLVLFETTDAGLSLGILLDTTGSMRGAIPVVKNATLRLIDQLRPNDFIAIYGFSTTLRVLQGFTSDKDAAKRAILNVRSGGRTALFDAISRVLSDLTPRKGKKALVAFTDGQDNASYLEPDAASTRARKVGVPLYTIAEGEALKNRQLVGILRNLSLRTGGISFTARKAGRIDEIFSRISEDLQHCYMLAYVAPPAENNDWRSIQVSVKGVKNARIRAKQGYFPK